MRSIVEKLMTDIMYEVPGSKGALKVRVTKDAVEGREPCRIEPNKKTA